MKLFILTEYVKLFIISGCVYENAEDTMKLYFYSDSWKTTVK